MNRKLTHCKILICDDEPAGLKVMQHLLQQKGFHNIQSFNDPVAALRYLSTTQVDLAFLDINMPKLNGLNLAKQLQSVFTQLVFVTAFAEHALASYDVEAMDFLTKPVSPERLEKTMQRFSMRYQQAALVSKQDSFDKTADSNGSTTDNGDFIRVTGTSTEYQIGFQELKFVQAANKYVVLHCIGDNVIWRNSLSQLMSQLPQQFVRIHRSSLINITWLDRLSYEDNRWWAVMLDSTRLPVSRQYKSQLSSAMENQKST